jgi:hypothetical protein
VLNIAYNVKSMTIPELRKELAHHKDINIGAKYGMGVSSFGRVVGVLKTDLPTSPTILREAEVRNELMSRRGN